jgi:hypothetical protein
MSDFLNSKNVNTSDLPEMPLEKKEMKTAKEHPIQNELSSQEQPSIKRIIKNSGNFISKSEISKFGLKAIENENKKNKFENINFSNLKNSNYTKTENENSENNKKNIITKNDQKIENENKRNINLIANKDDFVSINKRKNTNYPNEISNDNDRNISANEPMQNINNFEKINFVNNININNLIIIH